MCTEESLDDYMHCKHCGRVIVWDDWSFTHLDGWANCRMESDESRLDEQRHCEPISTHRINPQPATEAEARNIPKLAFIIDEFGVRHPWRKGDPLPQIVVHADTASKDAAA